MTLLDMQGMDRADTCGSGCGGGFGGGLGLGGFGGVGIPFGGGGFPIPNASFLSFVCCTPFI